MLGPPIVGEPMEPQSLKHFRPFLGTTMPRVKRNDAPGHQVLTAIDVVRRRIGSDCRYRHDREPGEDHSAEYHEEAVSLSPERPEARFMGWTTNQLSANNSANTASCRLRICNCMALRLRRTTTLQGIQNRQMFNQRSLQVLHAAGQSAKTTHQAAVTSDVIAQTAIAASLGDRRVKEEIEVDCPARPVRRIQISGYASACRWSSAIFSAGIAWQPARRLPLRDVRELRRFQLHLREPVG